MREVEVDALDAGVLGSDHAEGGADAAADVDQHFHVVEAAVSAEQSADHDGGVALHGLVEHLVEAWIGALVLEGRHPVGGHHWFFAVQH